MSWKCPQCGVEGSTSGARRCDVCGFIQFGRLLLTSEDTKKQIRVGVDTVMTRDLMRTICGAPIRVGAGPLFRLVRDRGLKSWAILLEPEALGIRLNDNPLTSRLAPLTEGDCIATSDGARIHVSFID